MAILEAWAHRLPVAMTAACNLPEGIEAGAAREIEVSALVMAESLSEFLNRDADTLQNMGERGFELVRDRFTWSAVAMELEKLYAELLSAKPLLQNLGKFLSV